LSGALDSCAPALLAVELGNRLEPVQIERRVGAVLEIEHPRHAFFENPVRLGGKRIAHALGGDRAPALHFPDSRSGFAARVGIAGGEPLRLASAPRPPLRMASSQAERGSGSTPEPASAPNSTR